MTCDFCDDTMRKHPDKSENFCHSRELDIEARVKKEIESQEISPCLLDPDHLEAFHAS